MQFQTQKGDTRSHTLGLPTFNFPDSYARTMSIDGLRPSFLTIDGIIYTLQIVLRLMIWWKAICNLLILPKVFLVFNCLQPLPSFCMEEGIYHKESKTTFIMFLT